MAKDDLEKELKKKAKKAKKKAKKLAEDIGEDISNIDLEKEALELVRGFETAFFAISEDLKRKREEMEAMGVKDTVKKDARRTAKTAKKVASEVIDDLEKALSDLRESIDKVE